jgi:hypothetical protein
MRATIELSNVQCRLDERIDSANAVARRSGIMRPHSYGCGVDFKARPYSRKPAKLFAGFLLRLDLRGLATNIICSCGDLRPELRATLSKRAPSTTRTSLRVFRIMSLQACG